jgi:GTP cyclohydrolase I
MGKRSAESSTSSSKTSSKKNKVSEEEKVWDSEVSVDTPSVSETPTPPPDSTMATVANAYGTILDALLTPVWRQNPGMAATPNRAAKALAAATSGVGRHWRDGVGAGVFDAEGGDGMVAVRRVQFFSMCEHHLLPFHGQAHVAYIPNGKILGLSKIPRIVEVYAKRPQVQERLTREIAMAIQEAVAPAGVGVVLEATHLCMAMRGVAKHEAVTTTSHVLGVFRDDPKTREEFLHLIKGL